MGWIKKLLGIEHIEGQISTLQNELIAERKKTSDLQAQLDEHIAFHTEDFGALAKRISDTESEVFDCSADDQTFDDE